MFVANSNHIECGEPPTNRLRELARSMGIYMHIYIKYK